MEATTQIAIPQAPGIPLRYFWFVAAAFIILVAAIASHQLWFLNFVHVFGGILWTGTDIFMGFILGPILRRLDLQTRRNVIVWLMPRLLFYMPTLSIITGTAGVYLARWLGFFDLPAPSIYWVVAALVVLVVLTVQGLGVLLPTNLRVYFELRKERPDGAKIQRLMSLYIKVVASQGLFQIGIIVIMARFATGF